MINDSKETVFFPPHPPAARVHNGRAEIYLRVLVDGVELPPRDAVRVLCAVLAGHIETMWHHSPEAAVANPQRDMVRAEIDADDALFDQLEKSVSTR